MRDVETSRSYAKQGVQGKPRRAAAAGDQQATRLLNVKCWDRPSLHRSWRVGAARALTTGAARQISRSILIAVLLEYGQTNELLNKREAPLATLSLTHSVAHTHRIHSVTLSCSLTMDMNEPLNKQGSHSTLSS